MFIDENNGTQYEKQSQNEIPSLQSKVTIK